MFSALHRLNADGLFGREVWLETLKQSWNYKRFTAPRRKSDDHIYFEYNDGLQSQLSLHRVKVGNEDTILTESGPGGELFFDSNMISLDGNASLTGFIMSPCGKYWAYGASEHDSDWMKIYVRETSSPHVHYHRLGEKQENDTLVHKNSGHPFWLWSLQTTPSGRYALLAASRDASHTHCQLVKMADLHNDIGTSMKWINLHDSWEARFSIIGDDDSKIFFMTNLNYKVAIFDACHPSPKANLITLVAEDPKRQPSVNTS
ncbi:prolyl oligopeptidase [Dendrothele bispora CBS 962.96]|uniref:Prolyl oligopeptidase n=1 Tax=Dendrothele bispora (strain CBS 962.96) TaxID=1314807 RepID=A0A4S8LRV0_DENBC|nr:prolyl oligopeptidase [Dendrothele bispora CBS 962.96]